MSRARNWCFTWNLTELNDNVEKARAVMATLINECDADPVVKYAICGLEVGLSGNLHIQGYVELKDGKTFKAMKDWIGDEVHLEPRRGTPKQASDYCKKDGDFLEIGEISKQGKRNDIEVLRDAVRHGATDEELLDEGLITSLFQLKFVEEMRRIYRVRRERIAPKVLWYYGPSGTGKTRSAVEAYPDAWISSRDLKWWQGYAGHKEIILDDFRGDFCKFHELLRILDRYHFAVEIKGGSVALEAEIIIITSPYHPTEVYKNFTDEEISQLTRRITEIKEFK